MSDQFSPVLEDALAKTPVIAIVRGTHESLESTLEWLRGNGVTAIEVTTNTPNWRDVFTRTRQMGFPAVGVGTVLTPDHVAMASEIGADFTVSPGLDEDVLDACRQRGLGHVPGVTTPSEIQKALRAGFATLKLFPAASLGLPYLKALHGPFDQVRFIPTGGIDIRAAMEWIRAGALAVGLGGSLTSSSTDVQGEWSRFLSQMNLWKVDKS